MDQLGLKLLRELQELEFALVELNLYLDTHPDDEAALSTFNKLSSRYAEVRRAYEEQTGPLINFGHSDSCRHADPSCDPWRWIEDPWPWEIEY